jgi:protein farnesyltransferase/geranylgeranyltransferase type-1 subunit alpha
MGKYDTDPTWSSITPIPLNDGSDYYVTNDGSGGDDGYVMPLATISYPEEYTEATAYLRALMAENEMSERALALTEDVINLNPAHYTVW